MSDLHVKYLLIGGGVASSEAAQAIRKLDREGDLLLVGQEINRPYNRPPLSKQFLRGELGREGLFTLSSEWFVNNRVQLRTGRRISHLDATRSHVTLDNGEGISFDRLLLAIGGAAAPLNIPGAEMPNLFYLRSLADAERLQHAAEKARKEGRTHPRGRGRVVVIGAGVLGVELAGSLSLMGLHVELVEAGNYPWHRFAGEITARCVTRILQKHEVVVHTSAPPMRLEGDGRVQRAILASGDAIPCDFAVAAVGLQIQKDILRGTPIAAEKAILVDSHCQSTIPGIYAAGDCAAVFDPKFAKHRPIQHWQDAAKTGQIAGTNMAGGEATLDDPSYFDTEIFDLPVDVWGESRVVDRRIIRGNAGAESPQFVEIGIASDGRVAQIIAIGKPPELQHLADLVRNRTVIDGNEERLKDPAIPLHEVSGA
jgi:3-phenylpropionate/trans-cinnamate dioxygenase ferredoxin reductase component